MLTLKCKKTSLFAGLSGFLLISFLLIGRVHYTIDVFAGFLYAAYIYDLTSKNLAFFDFIFNIPFKLIMLMVNRIR